MNMTDACSRTLPRNRRRQALSAGLLLCLVALEPPVARADERIEARRHFQTGMGFIGAGRYQEGIKELQQAYQLAPHPVVLYNIGRAYFDLRQYDPAIEYLVRYLTSDPPDRDQVERLVQQARARLDKERVPRPAASPVRPAASAAADETVPMDVAELRELSQKLQTIVDRLNKARETRPIAARLAEEAATSGAPSADRASSPAPGAHAPSTAPQPATGSSPGAPGDDPYAPFVVTSSRYRQSPLEAPNALTLLTAQDIRQSGALSLPDLLRRVPGLEVMGLSPSDYDVGIRGFNGTLSNKVLVLVDGRSIYLDFIGAQLWPLLSISLADVERIEVIRGPGAALYGANAFSGVINIITKLPGAPDDRNELTARYGTPDRRYGNARLTGRAGATAYRLSLGYEQADRWSIEIDPSRADYRVLARYPEQASHITRLDGRLDQRIGRHAALSVSAGFADGQAEFAAIGALRDFFSEGRYGYVRGDLTLPEGLSVRAFWNHFDAHAAPWAIPAGGLDLSSDPRSNVIDVEAQLHRDFHLGVDHRLNAGLGYRFKNVKWSWLDADHEEHHASLFLQDEAKVIDPLTVVFSLRMDRHPVLADREDAGFFDRYPVSPRGAVVWRVAEGQAVRATVGTAFRTPTFAENYLSQPIPTDVEAVAVLTRGNLDLGPERILSAEVGYLNQPVNNRYELEAAAYVNRVTDLIQLSSASPWTDPATAYDPRGFYYAGTTHFENLADAYTALGGELGGRVYPLDGLDAYANYAYEYIRQGEGDQATRFRSTSPHKVNAGVQYRSDLGIDVGADLHYVVGQTWPLRSYDANGQVVITDLTLPAYTWLGLRVGYRAFDNRLEVSIAGTNLLAPLRPADDDPTATPTPAHTHREYPLGQPVPLGLTGSITYRF
jgi:iron complex outermembrane receptor protein